MIPKNIFIFKFGVISFYVNENFEAENTPQEYHQPCLLPLPWMQFTRKEYFLGLSQDGNPCEVWKQKFETIA